MAPGEPYPGITVTVRVLNTTPALVTNTAIVSGGGEAFDLLRTQYRARRHTFNTARQLGGTSNRAVHACVLQSGIELPYRALRANIAEAVNLLIHIERRNGRRIVTEMLMLQSYDPALDRYDLEPVSIS